MPRSLVQGALKAKRLGSRRGRASLVATSALMVAGLLGAGAGAEAAPLPGQVSFSTPRLFPNFSPGVYDYVVR